MMATPDVEEAICTVGQRDHSITSEYAIYGAPGTGKTTAVSYLIRRAVQRFGKAAVLALSFSRAAAAELAGRDLPVGPGCVGTLHSCSYHSLGCPEIAEVHVAEWNRENPNLRITPAKKELKLDGEETGEETIADVRSGDYWLGELNRLRGMMRSVETWPSDLRDFATKWKGYKATHRLMDFCDLIETAHREFRIAPKRPDVIFVDEGQDLNAMQLALVRRWGKNAQYYVLAGDDDQTVLGWCGATPEGMLADLPDDHKIILQQSHRLPRSIHARANALIHQVSRRQEKLYAPRPEEGMCIDLTRGGYKSPEYWILKTMMAHLEHGQRVMCLASCSYMLHPMIAVLRQRGIPFHNPYRKSNGFWNPLRHGRKGSSTNRLLSLLGDQPWTHGDLKLWTEWLRPKGTLRSGASALIAASDPTLPVTVERLTELFETGAVAGLLAASTNPRELLQWWRGRLSPTFHGRAQFPVGVALVGGTSALEEVPHVVVGTIHSVKGGEADVVFLFPDLSRAGDAAYQKPGLPRDSVIRLLYVGMTRAKHTLYICQRESSLAVVI